MHKCLEKVLEEYSIPNQQNEYSVLPFFLLQSFIRECTNIVCLVYILLTFVGIPDYPDPVLGGGQPHDRICREDRLGPCQRGVS